MRVFAALVLAVLAAGCTVSEPLDPRFFPLARIQQVDGWPLAAGRVSTIYGACYTSDLAAFDAAFAPGSVYREAVLLHEQAHSVRQFQDPFWLAKYVASPSFRLQEEEVGYAIEIKYLRDHGAPFVPWKFANDLATGYAGMISLDDAVAWVQATLLAP